MLYSPVRSSVSDTRLILSTRKANVGGEHSGDVGHQNNRRQQGQQLDPVGRREQAAGSRIVVQGHEAKRDGHHLDDGDDLAENQCAGDDRQQVRGSRAGCGFRRRTTLPQVMKTIITAVSSVSLAGVSCRKKLT